MREIFYGREKELNEVTTRIIDSSHKFLVIYGQKHVGITTFLKQGILPTLEKPDRNVFYINFRHINATQYPEENIPEIEAPIQLLSQLTGKSYTIIKEEVQTKNHFVLILDHFIEIFKFPQKQFDQIIHDMQAALKDPSKDFRFVLALYEENFHKLFSLMNRLPGIANNVYDMKGLSYEDAQSVLIGESQKQNVKLPDTLISEFLSELARPNISPNGISPSFLNILIQQLFWNDTWQQYINLDQLLANYLNRICDSFKNERHIAEAIVQEIAFQNKPDIPFQLASLALRIGTTPETIEKILNRLTDEFVLLNQLGRQRYEIFHPYVAKYIKAQLEPILKKTEQTYRMLRRAYENWRLSEGIADSLMDKAEFSNLEQCCRFLTLPDDMIEFILYTALYWETRHHFRGASLYWLKRFEDIEKKEAIVFDVYDDTSLPQQMRLNAIQLFSHFDSESTYSEIVQLALEESDDQLRAALIATMKNMDREKLDPILFPLIQKHVENPSSEYRTEAIQILPLIPFKIALDLATKIIREKNPQPVKIAAIRAMSEFHQLEVTDKLFEVCLQNNDATVREEASNVLGALSNRLQAEHYIEKLSQKEENFNTALHAVWQRPTLKAQVGNGILLFVYFILGWFIHGLAHAFLKRYKIAFSILGTEIFGGLTLYLLTQNSPQPLSWLPLIFLACTFLYDLVGAYIITNRADPANQDIAGDFFRGIAIRSIFVMILGLFIHGTFHLSIKRRMMAGLLFTLEVIGFLAFIFNTNFGGLLFAILFILTLIVDVTMAYARSLWNLNSMERPLDDRFRAISPLIALLFGTAFWFHGLMNLSIKCYRRAIILFGLEILSLLLILIATNIPILILLAVILFLASYLFDISSSFSQVRKRLDKNLDEIENVAGDSAVLIYPLFLSLVLHGIVHLYIGKWRHALIIFIIELIGIFSFIFQDFFLMSSQATYIAVILFIGTFLYDILAGYLILHYLREQEAEKRLLYAYEHIRSPMVCDILLRKFNENDLTVFDILKASTNEYVIKEMIQIMKDSKSKIRTKAAQIIQSAHVKNEFIYIWLKDAIRQKKDLWLRDNTIKIFAKRKIYAALDSLKQTQKNIKGFAPFKLSLSILNLQIPSTVKYLVIGVLILFVFLAGYQISKQTNPVQDVEVLVELMHNRYVDSPETQIGFIEILGEIAKNPHPPRLYLDELLQFTYIKELFYPSDFKTKLLSEIYNFSGQLIEGEYINEDTLLLALQRSAIAQKDAKVKIIRRIDEEFRRIISDKNQNITVRKSAVTNWVNLLKLLERRDLQPLDAIPTFVVLRERLTDLQESQYFQKFILNELGHVSNQKITELMLDFYEQRIKSEPIIQEEALAQILSSDSPSMVRRLLNIALGLEKLKLNDQSEFVSFGQSGLQRYQHVEPLEPTSLIVDRAVKKLTQITNPQAIDSLFKIIDYYSREFKNQTYRQIMLKILTENGQLHSSQGKFDIAIQMFSKAQLLAPNRMELIKKTGYAYYHRKDSSRDDLSKAIENLKKVSQYETYDVILTQRLGECYFDSGLFRLAEEQFLKSIKIDSSNYLCYIYLAEISRRQNRFDQGLDYIAHALKIEPNFAWSYAVAGNIYFDMQDFEDAETSLLKAIELSPSYDWSYSKLRNTYHEMEQDQKAINKFESLAIHEANRPYALRQLAFIYHEYTFNFKKAYLRKTELESRFPDNPTVRSDMVENAFTIGQYKQALNRARNLLRNPSIPPQNRVILTFFSVCALLQMGQQGEALNELRNFEQALQELPPDFTRSWRFRGTRYYIEHKIRDKANQELMLELLAELEKKPETRL